MFDPDWNDTPCPINNLIWMNHQAKLEGVQLLIQRFPEAILMAWFTDTNKEFKRFLEEKTGSELVIKTPTTISPSQTNGKTVIVLEHYPLKGKEEALFKYWKADLIFILSALDEPFFKHFNGDGLISLMKKLGMDDNEVMEHPMINRSIEQAQHKLEALVVIDKAANSQQEWFEKNIH